MNTERLLCAIQSSPLWLSERPARGGGHASVLADCVDVAWYWRRYRQLREASFAIGDCVTDYLQHAGERYLSPNLAFDEFWYRHEHPEVDDLVRIGRYQSGWEHYLAEGAAKQLSPVFWFDERWYVRHNNDLAAGVANGSLTSGFEHYLLYGINQDLAPSIYFHPQWYREQYMQDVAGGRRSCAIVHYLLQDPNRRVCPVPFFEPAWYARQYAAALKEKDGCNKGIPAYEHYLLFGRRLGYSPSPYFNEGAYREIPQVAAKLRAGLYASGFEHYIAEGPVNGLHAQTHLPNSGVDYTSPEYLTMYERSLLMHLTGLRKLSDLTKQ